MFSWSLLKSIRPAALSIALIESVTSILGLNFGVPKSIYNASNLSIAAFSSLSKLSNESASNVKSLSI